MPKQTNDEKIKVALVIAGGVSLGSYEAGVLSELLYALDTLNAQTASDGGPHYELDIMSGGSAGGMTAALVARIMLYDLTGRRRHLYKAWVRDVDIIPLLEPESAPSNAFFSKRVIERIANKYIIQDADQSPTGPASFLPETLRLSLSLSNMNGISFEMPYFNRRNQKNQFVTTFFSDMARFSFDQNNPIPFDADTQKQVSWEAVTEAAIACGNFPFAFPPQEVRRTNEHYKNAIHPGTYYTDPLIFIDGGLFNNEPLREAILRASDADGGIVDPKRIFILIDPNINTSQHDRDVDVEADLKQQAYRIFAMLRGESTARDWLRAHRKNTELEWRNQFAKDLSRIIQEASIPHGEEIASKLRQLAEKIVQRKHALFGSPYDKNYLQRSINSTFSQKPFDGALSSLQATSDSKAKEDILKYMVFVLNSVAGLQNKQPIRLGLIGSNRDEVAGDQLFGFGGFFEEKWRDYDYRVGRRTAHGLLQGILGANYDLEHTSEGAEHPDYEMDHEEQQKYPHVTMEDVNQKQRERLRDVVLDRVGDVLKDFNVSRVKRWAIKKLFLKKKLDDALGL